MLLVHSVYSEYQLPGGTSRSVPVTGRRSNISDTILVSESFLLILNGFAQTVGKNYELVTVCFPTLAFRYSGVFWTSEIDSCMIDIGLISVGESVSKC